MKRNRQTVAIKPVLRMRASNELTVDGQYLFTDWTAPAVSPPGEDYMDRVRRVFRSKLPIKRLRGYELVAEILKGGRK